MPPKKHKPYIGIIKEKGPYVPAIGPSNPTIAFCGEAPGNEEEKEGKPFRGKAGRRLRELASEAGINLDDCWLTNVSKWRPPLNKFERLDEIGVNLQDCQRNLFKELRDIGPNVVVALGNEALHILTGQKKEITTLRGSVFPALYGDFKVLGTLHPSTIVRAENPWFKTEEGETANIKGKRVIIPEIVIADLIKAKKESATKKFLNPARNIEIITDAYKLYKFLNSYSDKEPTIDIEATYCIPDCISIAFNPWHIAVVPLMPILGKEGWFRLTETEYINLWITLSKWMMREDIKFTGANLKYDLEKLIAPARILHPYIRNKVAADIILMAGVLYPELPRTVEFLTSLFTNEPHYKDEGREYNPKKDSYKVYLFYNGKDSGVEKEIKCVLDKELGEVRRADYIPRARSDNDTFTLKDFYYGYINKLHDFYFDLEAEGLDVDIQRHSELNAQYEAKRVSLHLETEELVGTKFNVRSPKDVPAILHKMGLPPRADTKAETLVALLGNHTDPGSVQRKVLRNIIDERQLLTNFNYLHSSWDADRRMRSSWNPGGAETGRSSTRDLKPPLRPFKELPYKIGQAFQTLPKHGPFAKDIRSIYIAPPGYVFLERDKSQAEARIVAHLADDQETLKLFDTTDIHKLTASWIFGIPIESITDDQRFVGKTARHAGNYGEGKKRLMLDANSDALKFGINIFLSEKDAENIIATFHRKTPRIRGVFQKEVRELVQKTRTLWNPFGRMRQFFGLLKDTEAYAQLPQSTVPDDLRLAALRLRDRAPWLRPCVEAHDALVWKVREDRIDEALKITKEEMETPIDFRYCSVGRGKLTIPTEAKIGTRYSELKKVKE